MNENNQNTIKSSYNRNHYFYTKPLIVFLAISFSLLFNNCFVGDSTIEVELIDPNLAAEAPSGNDALSGSTNFSGKIFDPGEKADPLSAADFIAPPNISNYGAVSFSYKLELPPGRAGVMPQISLGYSSSGGDGWVGVGWSLGLGSISRTTKNGELFYDHRDTFTYSGKRLVKVSGAPNSENGVYRPEIEDGSFTRVTLTDAQSGGVWTVEESSGRKTIFGATRDERIYRPDSVTKTYTWQFSKSIDKNGNSMYAVYDASQYSTHHNLYLKEIRYTGNDNTGDAPKLFVRFHLKNRTDFYTSKGPGFIMKMDKLLDKIEMGKDDGGLLGESILWGYQMEYVISADSNRPLLKTIHSSKNTTKPVFHYLPAVHSFTWQKHANLFAADPETNPDITKYFEGDVDGDGISDMIFFNPKTGDWKVVESEHTGLRAFKNYGNKFAGYDTEEEIQWFKGNVTGDYDGNGKADIAFYLPKKKEFWVAESQGDRFEFKMYGKLTITDVDIFRAEWFTGDYDGNGISDVILYDEKTGYWIFMTNVGGAFSFIKFAQYFQNLYRDDYFPAQAMNSSGTSDFSKEGEDVGKVNWLGGDYNGDGRSDIAFYDSRDGKWWVAENLRDDVLGFRLEWKVYRVFNAPGRAMFSHHRFSGDFNGDGFSDFLLFDRDKLEWILGAVKNDSNGNATIDFSIWSAIPEQRDITRWLQGDFNGDGRSDIGFYSKTDQNFWIGEATPTGFRYRIYGNLGFGGPDPARVMATPAPEEGVEIKKVETLLPQSGVTRRISYEYDANKDKDHGEIVFTGCFIGPCTTDPEFLIYDKFTNKFSIKQGNGGVVDTSIIFNNTTMANKFITPQKPFFNKISQKDEIIVYEEGPSAHKLFRIFHNGTMFEKKLYASISKSGPGVANFDIKKSLYMLNDFDADGAPDVLVLDDQNSGNLFLYSNNTETSLVVTPTGIPGFPDLKNIFRTQQTGNDRDSRYSWQFFTGDFDTLSNGVELLFADMRQSPQKWYLGTLNTVAQTAAVRVLTGTIDLPTPGAEVSYEGLGRTVDLSGSGSGMSAGELVYHTVSKSAFTLHRLVVDSVQNTISRVDYSPLPEGSNFRWEFNHQNKPIVNTETGPKFMAFGATGSSYTLETHDLTTPEYPVIDVPRPDLYTKVYPFRWIQGDYNGDSKTDIGIFHLKEADWYFAMTSGTVPDMIEQVENGIGGFYNFEYANSSGFDNTGLDNIPDLAINYKVCVRQTVNNGLGQIVYNKYEYKDGFAWSAFIDGKKESDAFGFSTFTTIDALGSMKINTYYTTPYADFRLNRALSGALKETQFLGHDAIEYSRSQTDYLTAEIQPSPGVISYLVYPSQTRKYVHGTLTNTGTKNIQFSLSEYRLLQNAETSTDHYSDSAHAASSVTSISNFEYVAATNHQRPASQITNVSTPFELTTSISYDGVGNPIEQSTSYTGTGLPSVSDKLVKTEYDAYGNVTAQEDASQSPAIRSETQFDSTYHQFPVLTRQFTGSMNLDSTTLYDFEGVNFGTPIQSTNANGNSTYIEYDSYGRVVRIKSDTDSGVQTLSEYEYSLPAAFFGAGEFPLSAKTTHYTGTPVNIQSRVWRDGFGRHVQTVQSALDGVAGKQFIKTGLVVYDALGRVTRQSQRHWAADHEIDAYIPSLTEKNATISEYDASGRAKKIILPQSYVGEPETSVTSTYNDPYEMTATHSSGQSKTTTTNGRGHVLYVKEFNINDASLTTQMGFCYDGVSGGQTYRQDLNGASMNCPAEFSVQTVPSARDASGNNASYALYDAYGQLRESNDPDFGKSTTDYDAFGRMILTRDAKGQIFQFAYDILGRMRTKTLPGGSTVKYKYDSLSGSANAKGKLVEMVDASQRKRFSYGKRGQRKKEKRELKTVTIKKSGYESAVTTNFAYDLVGRTEKIIYPVDTTTGQQTTVCYGYNSFGFAASVDVSFSNDCLSVDKTIVSNMEYDEFGSVTKVDMGNGVSTAYVYDVRGRATNMTTTATVNGKTVKHQDVQYSYNTNNSISNVINNPTAEDAGGAIVPAFESRYEYTYDGLNRLVEAKGSYGKSGFVNGDPLDIGNQKYNRTYAYAKNGNLIQKNILDPETQGVTDGWNYAYENHRAVSIDTTETGGQRFRFSYDGNGNTVTKVDTQKKLTKTMVYDHANRIRKVKDQTGKVMGEYKYDDQGVRVRKIVEKVIGGENRRVVMSTHNKYYVTEKLQTPDGWDIPGTDIAINNVYLNGVRIASMDSNGKAAYYLANHVDSVKVVTDDNGVAVNRTEYLPYGETFQQEGDIKFGPKYNGQAFDEESDLYFFNARHYDPEVARFVTADTVTDGPGTIKGWNRYMYVGGNPIMYKDPTGHQGFGTPMGLQNRMARQEPPPPPADPSDAGKKIGDRGLPKKGEFNVVYSEAEVTYALGASVARIEITDYQGTKQTIKILSGNVGISDGIAPYSIGTFKSGNGDVKAGDFKVTSVGGVSALWVNTTILEIQLNDKAVESGKSLAMDNGKKIRSFPMPVVGPAIDNGLPNASYSLPIPIPPLSDTTVTLKEIQAQKKQRAEYLKRQKTKKEIWQSGKDKSILRYNVPKRTAGSAAGK
ncbi:MAG: SpvB/TcaC N-terminal domain-containing protein [Leptospirales bacterium]